MFIVVWCRVNFLSRFQHFSARFRRAEHEAGAEGSEDATPNPVLVNIARTYMRRLQEDEKARRAEALRRAQDTLDRERAAASHQDHDDDDVDELDGEPPHEDHHHHQDHDAVIQKISPH